MLADKHLQKLTEPSSSSSGDTDKGPTSLHQSSLNQVLEQLRCAVEGEEATTTYACGGSIAVGSPEAKYATTEKHSQSDFEDQEVERRNKARKRDENRSGLDLPAEIKTPDNIDTSAPVVSAPVSIYWSPEKSQMRNEFCFHSGNPREVAQMR